MENIVGEKGKMGDLGLLPQVMFSLHIFQETLFDLIFYVPFTS
jgi:hypothetical protein